MSRKAITVEQFMQSLDHPYKAEVEAVRAIILNADSQIREQIKWNAPSFGYKGEDRVTFRLHPPINIQLIFHRGAKVHDGSTPFSFEDTSGLLQWVTTDRGTVTLRNMDEVQAHTAALTELVKQWMQATNA